MADHTVLIAKLRDRFPDSGYVYVLADEAADALEAQAREIEALRADAGRYRWLRDNTEGVWAICKWECNSTLDMEGYYRDGRAPAIVDAAIDAAMSAEQGVAS